MAKISKKIKKVSGRPKALSNKTRKPIRKTVTKKKKQAHLAPSLSAPIKGMAVEQSKYFTPLESPAIYGGDERYESLIPYRKGGVKAPSFLTGFTHPETRVTAQTAVFE